MFNYMCSSVFIGRDEDKERGERGLTLRINCSPFQTDRVYQEDEFMAGNVPL